jgi:PAS domain S-box-containing protein
MADLPTLPHRSPIEKTSIALALALVAIGLATCVGWALQISPLLQPIPDLPACKLNEALCFVILGASLLLTEYHLAKYSWVAVMALVLALLSLMENVAGWDFHIDELLLKDFVLVDTAFPGRMATMTAGCLLLAGISLLWRSAVVGRNQRLFFEAVTGSVVFSVGLSTLLGYAVNLPGVYRWGSSSATCIVSGLALLILGIELLLNAWRASYQEESGPPSWSPMPPVIACFTLSVILFIGMRERELLYLSSTTQNTLNSVVAATDLGWKDLENEINDYMASPWSRSNETEMGRENDGAVVFNQLSEFGCMSVSWVDLSLHSRWVYPRAGNEEALAFDHMSDEVRALAIKETNSTRRPSISQTLNTSKGPGFAIYAPVIRDNRIAGYAVAEFTYAGFFSQIDRKYKVSANYKLLIAVNNSVVLGDQYSDALSWSSNTLELSLNSQNRKLRFGICPNEQNLQASRRFLPELTLFSGLGITFLLGLSVHFARRSRSSLLAAENYNRRLKAENEERKRIEDRLKTSDERLRLALDSTSIGIFEWDIPSAYVYYSTGFWSMLDYEPNRMAATIDTLQSLIHPEDLPQFRRRIDAQLSGVASFIDPEFRVRSRTGDWRWVYWRARSVVLAPTGAPTRVIGTMQDITSRREAEEALRASQAATRKLSLVASRTDNLVVILTPDGRVEWVNESFSRSFEYTLGEICGKRLAEFLAGAETDPRSIGRVRNGLSHGQPISTDLVQYAKSGRKFHLAYDIQPVRNKSAEIENFIAVASDITARVETEQALRRAKSEADAASRAKSEFLASMSHEIRTPMNGVIGMTSLLLETALNQEQREYVNTIRNSGEALLTIINDILDFSKIESGKMELERLPFDLSGCIEEALELFAVQASAKHLELVYHIERGVPPVILGDITRLRQVLVNLVNNAVKFTPKGCISVEVAQAPGDPLELGVPPGRTLLEFTVRDTGIGIPADRINRLFRIFSQVDSSTTRKFGGTGLGLAICERLCSLMGGSIRVESTEGKGSAFIFTIQTEAASNLRVDELPPLPAALQKSQVLALEDNSVSQRRLNSLLLAWGANVAFATTPEELLALAKGATIPPALLMIDLDPEKGTSMLTHFSAISAPRLVMLPYGSAPPDSPVDGHSYSYIAKPIRAGGLYQTIINIFTSSTASVVDGIAMPQGPVLGELIPLDVLLVEDNPVNQKVALRFLDRLGYKADAASNGLEALQAMETRNYHLVLMDLQMPEMDGLEASRQIRHRFSADRQPKIVALTANALRGDREQCLAAGMDDYVAKPVKMQEIADAIKRQFGSKEEKSALL